MYIYMCIRIYMSVVDASWVLRVPCPVGLVWQNSTGTRLCNNRPDYLLFNQEYTSNHTSGPIIL